MKVSTDVVRHVARLARLSVPDERLDGLARDLSAILDYADQLGGVSGLDLSVASEASEAPLPRRADAVEAPMGVALVALAADRVGDEVRVPNVVGEVT